MKSVRCFTPGKRFPAISITGSRCELLCPHCMGRPLSGMIDANTPEKLLAIASDLEKNDAIGFLLSGGCNSDGILPVKAYLPAVRTIKDRDHLKINAHVGFPREKDAGDLVASGIDAFSITFPMNDKVGLGILKIPNAIDRYFETFDSLEDSGAKKTVPHILMGLIGIDEEIEGLRLLSSRPLKSLVIISFHPLAGTPMHASSPTDEKHMIEFVEKCRSTFPDAQIVIGCMRQRGMSNAEIQMMEKYVDGIVMPGRESIKSVSSKVNIEKLDGCCALYL